MTYQKFQELIATDSFVNWQVCDKFKQPVKQLTSWDEFFTKVDKCVYCYYMYKIHAEHILACQPELQRVRELMERCSAPNYKATLDLLINAKTVEEVTAIQKNFNSNIR